MSSPRPIPAMLLFFSLVWLLPALACGSSSDSTPTPTFSQAAATRGSSQGEAIASTSTPRIFNVDTICLPSERQKEIQELQRLILKFSDVTQVAGSTPRIQLPSMVLEMQSTYRETWTLTPTLCGEVVKQQTLTAMQTIIEGFSLFMQGSEHEASASVKLNEGLAQFEIVGERFQDLVYNPALLLTPTPVTTVPKMSGATVNANANLRAGPGTTFDVVGGVSAGDALTVVGRNEAGDWYKTTDGKWIASFLVNNAPNDLPVTND
jgi:hypothetical protein